VANSFYCNLGVVLLCCNKILVFCQKGGRMFAGLEQIVEVIVVAVAIAIIAAAIIDLKETRSSENGSGER